MMEGFSCPCPDLIKTIRSSVNADWLLSITGFDSYFTWKVVNSLLLNIFDSEGFLSIHSSFALISSFPVFFNLFFCNHRLPTPSFFYLLLFLSPIISLKWSSFRVIKIHTTHLGGRESPYSASTHISASEDWACARHACTSFLVALAIYLGTPIRIPHCLRHAPCHVRFMFAFINRRWRGEVCVWLSLLDLHVTDL